ncbi:Retrotransposable element SLACS protein [Nymphon striatum]|nr:Retrotransposable element SLACS protein [Nymphon striatum]
MDKEKQEKINLPRGILDRKGTPLASGASLVFDLHTAMAPADRPLGEDENLIPCWKCNVGDSNSRRRQWIACSVCKAWFHITCVKVTKRLIEAIGNWTGPCCAAPSQTPRPTNFQTPENCEPDILNFSRKGSVLKRVPKASRIQAAKLLTDLINKVLVDNSTNAWENVFRFARGCFSNPNRGGRNSKSLATVVNHQIRNFMVYIGDDKHPQNSVEKSNKKSNPTLAKLVSSKIATGDVRGAVRIVSSESSIVKASAEVCQKLREMHPEPHIDTAFPLSPTDQEKSNSIILTVGNVRAAILSFKNGSAGGPDGLLPQHLKDLTAEALGEISSSLLEVLTKLLNCIVLSGDIPENVCPTFYGASLMALSKKDGGLRPIAIGNTLRRLVGKACMAKLSATCSRTFRPHQLGVGTRLGAEAAVHSCRRFLCHIPSSEKVLLKIDFKNAFNSVRRDLILKEAKNHAPEVYPLVYQCYSHKSHLFFDNYTLSSMEGVQQGDPLGPFLFSLAIMELIRSCESELNMWYLDDGTIGGEAESVLSDFKKIIAAASDLGLQINPAKCELVIFNPIKKVHTDISEKFKEITPQIKLIKAEDLTLLGAPILPTATETVLNSKLEELTLMSERLSELDSHDALYLLKHCFAIPKLMYFLRSSPCFDSEILKVYDQKLRSSLEKVLNTHLSETTWTQCSLPVAQGGLGVRSAVDLALPAFLSSAHACNILLEALLPQIVFSDLYQEISVAESKWLEKMGPLNVTPLLPAVQASWDAPLCKLKCIGLLSTATSEKDKARLLASTSKHSSDWLNAIPIPSLGLKMDNSQLRIACSLRLGSPMCIPHECKCGTMVDNSGTHGLSCKKSAGRHARHSAVNDILKRALSSANFPSVLEPTGVVRSDGKRPDGMSIFPWRNGKILVWDFTCSDTVAPSHLAVASCSAGKVAENAENAKLAKYSGLSGSYEFVPVCVETLGPWGPNGLKLIQEIGNLIKIETNEPRATTFLKQSVSMAIQRGNAASVIGTVVALPSVKTPRDLTLGGAKKRSFAPNLIARKLSQSSTSEISVKKETESNNRIPKQEKQFKNKGHGKNKHEFIQTTGSIFSEGPGRRPVKRETDAPPRSSRSKDNVHSNISIKREPKEEENISMQKLLCDDFIDDPESGSDEDDFSPVVIPLPKIKKETVKLEVDGSGDKEFREIEEKVQKLCSDETSISDEIPPLLEILSGSTENTAHVVLSQLEEIKSVVKAVYQKPETDMGDYWLSFLEMTDPLAQNVHACHTQQYYEDVSSSYEMFPGLMAYNNHEYGRHLPDFWAMLNNLSEDQSRYFSLHFAQSQTGLPYSCQPMDLGIEVTMNLGSKLKAGWLQLLQDDKQLFSTIRNANAVGRIRQALETQLNSKRKQSKHTDCQPARLRKDEKAVQDILTSLDAFECDLFGEDDPALRSIQSGIKTTESVALDLSVALPDGKAQADILLDQRVFSKDFKLSDRVPKNKRLTFDNNKVAKSGNKAISQAQMESAGLAAVIELAEGTGALTLEEIMENRVTEECLSIFNVDGSLRHTAKSKLFEHLNLQPTADKPAIYSSLIDMSMLFRLATPADREKKKQDGSDYKWQDYIDKICFMVHSRHPDAEQTYAINDPYPKPNEYSINDDERDRRAASHPNAGNKFPTRDEKFPGPKEFSSFMSNSQNKVRLQNLVRQCLTNRVERNRTIWVNKGETTNLGTGEDHPDLIFNHTEADTMIFGIYAKLRAVYTQPIIIDSEDTDVYIQAAYVAKRTTGKMYIKRKKHLIDCTTLVDNEVADSIIAAHVISGSDHSSGFYHKGKASIIKCVITDAEARELLSGLGQEPELSEPVEAAAK